MEVGRRIVRDAPAAAAAHEHADTDDDLQVQQVDQQRDVDSVPAQEQREHHGREQRCATRRAQRECACDERDKGKRLDTALHERRLADVPVERTRADQLPGGNRNECGSEKEGERRERVREAVTDRHVDGDGPRRGRGWLF